jgi:3-methylcrotonyl-CoA carboxylase alpha subunit
MGLKGAAKALMIKAGVPVVPGYHGDDQTIAHLAKEAERVGFPVLIKAVAGGGGKGMRRVDKAADFAKALEGAQREAQAAFGDARVLVEKYVAAPRHVEIQVFADGHGNAVHLFERDCSCSSGQKVIEEAPAFRYAGRRASYGRGGGQVREGHRLSGCGNGRVHCRWVAWAEGRRVLFHGDEHAAAGRAPGHGDDHGA